MKTKFRINLEALREELAQAHPELFDLLQPVPFKIGIWHDIHAVKPDVKIGMVMALLGWLTNRRAYLRACSLGRERVGFEGPAGAVTEKEAAWAVTRLAEREAHAIELQAEFAARTAKREDRKAKV